MESFFPVPVSQPSISVLPFSFDEHGLLKLPADESAITLVSPWAVVNSPSSAFSYHASTLAPLFVQPPHWSDINQQQLGNCWFLASICSILNLPYGTLRVLQMMREEGEFVFVRLFDKQKKAHYIKLEKSIVYSMGGSEYHAKMGSGLGTWPVFLEKALTAFDKERNFVPQHANYGRTVGGYGEEGLALLLGVDTLKLTVTRPQLDEDAATTKFKSRLLSLFSGALNETNPGHLEILKEFFGPRYPTIYWGIWKQWLDSLKPRDLMQELLDEIAGRQEQTRIVWHKGTFTDMYVDSKVELKKAAGVFRLEHFNVWFERRNGRLNVLVARAVLDSIQRFNLLPGKRGTGIYAPSQLTTYNTLLALCQAGTPTTASTRAYLGRTGQVGEEPTKQFQNDTVKGLVPNHEYSVKSVFKTGNQCFIKLINPWGRVGRRLVTDEPDRRPFASIRSTPVAETENAVFDLDLDDFTKRFDYISHANEKLRDLGS